MAEPVSESARGIKPSELSHIGEWKAGDPCTGVIVNRLEGLSVLRLTCQPKPRSAPDLRRKLFGARFVDGQAPIEHPRKLDFRNAKSAGNDRLLQALPLRDFANCFARRRSPGWAKFSVDAQLALPMQKILSLVTWAQSIVSPLIGTPC